MGTNSWGSSLRLVRLRRKSPLQEVRICELLAKDKAETARGPLKEVWSKPANSRTDRRRQRPRVVAAGSAATGKRHTRLSPRTSRHNTSEVFQFNYEGSARGGSAFGGKWRGCAGEVCAPYLGRPAPQRPKRTTLPGDRWAEGAGVSGGHSSVESRESRLERRAKRKS